MSNYSAAFREALAEYDRGGFEVEARDGTIGNVDEATYAEREENSLVVDTGLFGKKLPLPAGVIREIDVERRAIVADVTKEQVKNGPEYDSDRGFDDDLRSQVKSHYTGGAGAGPDEREDEGPGSSRGLDDIRAEEPVENTVHNLVQTLSVKLDSAARYRLYQEDARKDGYERGVEIFARLEERDRESIRDLLHALHDRLGDEGGSRRDERGAESETS